MNLPGSRRLALTLAVLITLAVPVIGCAGTDDEAAAPSDVTAIIGARIIDGNGGVPVVDGVLVIRGDRIEAVGAAAAVTVPDGARIIDAIGRTALPGLADMHVHLGQGGWDGTTADFLGFQRYVNALLYAGVTTVLTLGDSGPHIHQIHDEIEADRLLGPRVYFAGPLFDGPEPQWPETSYAISSVPQMQGYVRKLKAAGVHVIKGYVGLSDEMLVQLVEAAALEELPVIVDVWRRNGSAGSAATGIAAFAHLGGQVTDEAIEVMLREGVATITTATLADARLRWQERGGDFAAAPLVGAVTPPWRFEPLTDVVIRGQGTTYGSGGAERRSALLQNAKRMFDAGVMLVAGTDTPAPGLFFGEGLHRELELLVEAGLTPLQAISTATRNAALLMQAEDWGTLEAGKRADVLVVDGDPSVSIGDTRNITMLLQDGRIVDRRQLEFDSATDPGYRAAGNVTRPQ
ncbi:MAG TPA: amidohydrolase family protein [Acidobacteriota bacterium]|nr:amidohydrolase family protein [Acidobacteriota bacterium]